MLVYLFIFLLFLFQLDARLVVRDEKFDQRLHIGEWDWNIFIYFWQFQHLSYLALHFFQEAQDVYIDLSVRGCHFFKGARAAPPFPNLLHIWSLKVLYNWLHHIQYKTIPYHNHICCLGVFDAESFCWLRCSPGAGAEFLPSPDDLSPALLAEILSRWLGDSRMGRCDSYCRLMM